MLKKTGSFYYHCDWHASHYVKVVLDRVELHGFDGWWAKGQKTEERQFSEPARDRASYTGEDKQEALELWRGSFI